MMRYHEPVLLQESIQGLAIRPGGTYADATFGGGGHAAALLSQLGPSGRLFAFDRDAEAHSNAPEDARLSCIHQNFEHLQVMLKAQGITRLDGLLADLGVSSHQFDAGERGFSIRFDAPLDMRMNASATLRAYEVVNTYSEVHLQRIFTDYGELRAARALARRLVQVRAQAPIETTFQLREALRAFAPRGGENRFYAQVFQAIRIEVNSELQALRHLLEQGLCLLRSGGRFVVITYHSLEDRLVKRFFKTGDVDGRQQKDFYGQVHSPFRLINRRVIRPAQLEIAQNKRARSAKLRIAEKR